MQLLTIVAVVKGIIPLFAKNDRIGKELTPCRSGVRLDSRRARRRETGNWQTALCKTKLLGVWRNW